MTRSTIMSSPRAATSVAMSTRNLPFRNASIVLSRVFWGMSPCSGLASNLRPSSIDSSLHSSLVSQKMITRPVAPAYMEMTSLMVEARLCQCAGIAMCRTSVEAFTALFPTMSMVSALVMYLTATSLTQGGMVAEKRQVCRPGKVHAPRIISMSSANPMSSIWSASSRHANRHLEARSRVPFSRWSLILPGVPTTTSTPARRASNCGG
mmetsp:Transcript_57894/g.131201  ORF Transcript_57894/g.131201 Transcript_57894/m.131201 type:complete len:208 (+) Transcript_57894:781-1404(+)